MDRPFDVAIVGGGVVGCAVARELSRHDLGVVVLEASGAVSLGAGHWIAPLLFRESARDPIVFATVAIVLLAATISASWFPAVRAARVDPQEALRAE